MVGGDAGGDGDGERAGDDTEAMDVHDGSGAGAAGDHGPASGTTVGEAGEPEAAVGEKRARGERGKRKRKSRAGTGGDTRAYDADRGPVDG